MPRLAAALALAIALPAAGTDPARKLGPFTTDGCSLFPDRDELRRLDWSACCVEHDVAYWRGGTRAERLRADEALRACVVERTGDARLAELVFRGVRAGGEAVFPTSYRWGYGWSYGRLYAPLTADERARADAELARWRAGRTPESQARSTGMHDTVLIVRGWTEQELEQIVRAFRELYEDRPGPAFRAETVSSDGSLRVSFPEGIDPTTLAFLVNYVQYPKDFDLRARRILAIARVTLTSEFDLPDLGLVGQKAIVYVPRNDREYDVVYVRTEAGATYERSFASSTWKPVRDPRLPDGVDGLR